MSLKHLEAKRIWPIREMRLAKTQTAMIHTKNADAMFIILGGKALDKRLELKDASSKFSAFIVR